MEDFLSKEEERMAWRTQLVISFMSSLRLAEISRAWNGEGEGAIPSTRLFAEPPLLTTMPARGMEPAATQPLLLSSSSRCCLDSELSHCS